MTSILESIWHARKRTPSNKPSSETKLEDRQAALGTLVTQARVANCAAAGNLEYTIKALLDERLKMSQASSR